MLKFDRQVAALKERREAEEAKLVATRQKRWAGGWTRFQEENRLREERRRRLRCVPYFALDRKSIAIPIELVRL